MAPRPCQRPQESPGTPSNARRVIDFAGTLRGIVAREGRDGYARLAGARVSGVLPADGKIANALLQAQPRPAALREVAIAFQANNRGTLLLGIDLFPFPRQMEIPVALEPVVATPGRPVVVLHLEPGGIWGMVVPRLLALKPAPGVSSQGNTLFLDLAAMAPPDAAPLLSHLVRLELRTVPGRLDIHFELHVKEPA